MIYGTAGFTAGLSAHSLTHTVTPEDGEVLVTGATGGVGSITVAILSKLGYKVVAVSGKADMAAFLKAGVAEAVEKTVAEFGGIDIVVNNASAIQLTNTQMTDLKRYDLMTGINSRGTFLVTKTCVPHLLKSDHAHVLTLSPPLDFAPQWFRNHAAYSLAKYGMSVLSVGWAAEFEGKIAVNCLWPRTTIDTAAVRNLLGGDAMASKSRTPQIMGDAAVAILAKGTDFSGWFCMDDLVLAAEGVTDFDIYAVTPEAKLQLDFFVPQSAPDPDKAEGMVGWRAPVL
jgi:citronellol/citronellal dehydrogenase